MKQQNEVHQLPSSAAKRMLLGATIGLAVISIFLGGAGEPKPEWPALWMLKPLLIVPAAGALGGLFDYNLDHLREQGGWRQVFGYALGLVVFVIVLWLGIVLGLDGTMWD